MWAAQAKVERQNPDLTGFTNSAAPVSYDLTVYEIYSYVKKTIVPQTPMVFQQKKTLNWFYIKVL